MPTSKGALTTGQIKKNLFARMSVRVGQYLTMKKQHEDKEANELQQLYDMYGREAVVSLISSGKIVAATSPFDTSVNESAATELKTSSGKKRSRRKGMSMTDLRPHFNKALNRFRGKGEFTSHDVIGALPQGLEFDPSYISWLLRNDNRLKVRGKVQNPGKGPPLNQYVYNK